MIRRIIFLILIACTHFATIGGNQNNRNEYAMELNNYSIYYLDSVYLSNYTIIESGINHQLFLVPDSNYKQPIYNIFYWDLPNCIFYWERYFPLAEYMESWNNIEYVNSFEKIWPYPITYKQYIISNKKDKDCICKFQQPKPTLFAKFLMTGNVYNYLSHGDCLDCIVPDTVNFMNPNAYYMVYVPIR